MEKLSQWFNNNKKLMLLLLIVVLCIIPPFTTGTGLRLMTITMIYCISSCGLMLIFGMGGLFCTGYVAFFGVGAYTAAILTKAYGIPTLPMMLISGIVTSFVGLIVCLPILRLSADFVGMISTAFLNIFQAIITGWELTGGATGLYRVPKISFFGKTITDKKAQFYIIFALAIIIIWLVNNLLNSKIGRSMKGIRDNEIGTIAIGVQARKMKLLTFAVGTFLAGMAGCLYAQYMGAVTPSAFVFAISTQFVQMCVIGGIGTLPGTMLGTAFITMVPEIFRPLATYRLGIAGLLMVLLMVFRPQGLLGSRAYAGDQGVIDRIRQSMALKKSKQMQTEVRK